MAKVHLSFLVAIFCMPLKCLEAIPRNEAVAEGSMEDSVEVDAEYPVYPCSTSTSISDLKSLARLNESCWGKDSDIEFWIAACSCYMDPRFPCPDCPPSPPPEKDRTSTFANDRNHNPSISRKPTAKPTPRLKLVPFLRTGDEVDHGKLVIRNNTGSHHFIRFG